MNILFLTLVKIDTLEDRGIYHDLMREFVSKGHNVYVVSPSERREKKGSKLKSENNVKFLTVRTLNVQKASLIEKGLSTLSIENLFLRGLKKYFSDVKFDLVIYSTPPITFTKIISFIKNKDGATSYLLLKDIFPQNAVDMKMLQRHGIIYRYFRNKEKKLYEISDAIGCMSQANKQYIIDHNPELAAEKVEVNPNSISPIVSKELNIEDKNRIRSNYGLPLDKKVFIYGGNLGIPQGLDFLLETIEATKAEQAVFFLIVGAGTEFKRIQLWFSENRPKNAKLLSGLEKKEYDVLLSACDVGMIFLNPNFTIPNYPSRLLSYLENGQPVLVAADPNTDIGYDLELNECGMSVLSGNVKQMKEAISYLCNVNEIEFNVLKSNARKYLEKEFAVKNSYSKIMNKVSA